MVRTASDGAWRGLVAVMALLVASLSGCPRDRGEASGPAPAPRTAAEDGGRPAPRELPDREEQQRRSEAVRRAAEELALRGINTTEYLMQLVVEDETYRVSFVRRSGRTLTSEVRVRIRRSDFEIVSIEGVPDAGAGSPGAPPG